MKRRDFVKYFASYSGLTAFCGHSFRLNAQPADYTGKFLLTVQLTGGWDVASCCDPKENQAGEPEITRWSNTDDIQQAANLLYAPYGSNEQLFENHHDKMLVINGVDAQTNAHSTGVLINWSGRNAEGLPSLTALFAAIQGPELPLAYVNISGFGNTQNVIRSSRIGDVGSISNVISPNLNESTQLNYREQSEIERILAFQAESLGALTGEANLPARNRQNRLNYLDAIQRSDGLKRFGDLIPSFDQLQPSMESQGIVNTLHSQVQIALLAFKSGVCVAADVADGDFDTHANHDEEHEPTLALSLQAVDYLWNYAEELGIADRLVVVLGSDFGRTPFYNAVNGKDHWPIGSYIVMEKGVGWTGRAVGHTDELINAHSINPLTLKRDDVSGTIIYPKHVHKALRRYLGIDDHPISSLFPFNNTEDFEFFA